MSLKVGDRCLLVAKPSDCGSPNCHRYLGQEVVLRRWDLASQAWGIVADDGFTMAAKSWCLVKKKPDDKTIRQETTTWDQCQWKPRSVSA